MAYVKGYQMDAGKVSKMVVGMVMLRGKMMALTKESWMVVGTEWMKDLMMEDLMAQESMSHK